MQLFEKQDVFIHDLVATINIYEGELFNLYVDRGGAFFNDEFWTSKASWTIAMKQSL